MWHKHQFYLSLSSMAASGCFATRNSMRTTMRRGLSGRRLRSQGHNAHRVCCHGLYPVNRIQTPASRSCSATHKTNSICNGAARQDLCGRHMVIFGRLKGDCRQRRCICYIGWIYVDLWVWVDAEDYFYFRGLCVNGKCKTRIWWVLNWFIRLMKSGCCGFYRCRS